MKKTNLFLSVLFFSLMAQTAFANINGWNQIIGQKTTQQQKLCLKIMADYISVLIKGNEYLNYPYLLPEAEEIQLSFTRAHNAFKQGHLSKIVVKFANNSVLESNVNQGYELRYGMHSQNYYALPTLYTGPKGQRKIKLYSERSSFQMNLGECGYGGSYPNAGTYVISR